MKLGPGEFYVKLWSFMCIGALKGQYHRDQQGMESEW